ncbi:MAG: general stress protein [Patescibacteria group bacterium]
MSSMVIGVFSNRTNAESALEELKDTGYNAKDISIVMKDTAEAQEVASSTGSNVAGGAATGATTGGVIGALAGLLVGIGAIAIPGLGALLIGGPIAAALGLGGAAASTVSGAVTGALAGGLLGALMGLGIPEEDAKVYEQRVQAGGILVAVPARTGEGTEAREILENNGAEQIKSVTTKF